MIILQAIKLCCQVHVQVTSCFQKMFKKEAILFTLRACYMRSNFACLGEHPTHRNVADMLNLIYFHEHYLLDSCHVTA